MLSNFFVWKHIYTIQKAFGDLEVLVELSLLRLILTLQMLQLLEKKNRQSSLRLTFLFRKSNDKFPRWEKDTMLNWI